MCFTPAVSLSTTVIEFNLAAIMPWKYRRARTRWFFSLFIFLLGIYQLTEFFLCQTGDAGLWVKAGFIIYTTLPALGLHSIAYYSKIKINKTLIYTLPAIFILSALLSPNFVMEGRCETIFITARTIWENYSGPLGFLGVAIYKSYYFSFIIATCVLSIKKYYREKNPRRKKLYLIFPMAVLLMTVPTFVLLIIFPSLQIMFPSVFCHFALLLALTAFIGVRMENSVNKR